MIDHFSSEKAILVLQPTNLTQSFNWRAIDNQLKIDDEILARQFLPIFTIRILIASC